MTIQRENEIVATTIYIIYLTAIHFMAIVMLSPSVDLFFQIHR